MYIYTHYSPSCILEKEKEKEKASKPIDSNGTSAALAAGGETGVEADRFAARSAPSILWLATGRADRAP